MDIYKISRKFETLLSKEYEKSTDRLVKKVLTQSFPEIILDWKSKKLIFVFYAPRDTHWGYNLGNGEYSVFKALKRGFCFDENEEEDIIEHYNLMASQFEECVAWCRKKAMLYEKYINKKKKEA